MDMILGIDAFSYDQEEHCGAKWFSYHLLNELLPYLGRDHHNRVFLYAFKDFAPLEPLPFNVQKNLFPFSKFWGFIKFSLDLFKKPVDVLLVSVTYLPLFFPKKTVVTLPNVAFRRIPKTYNFFQRYFLHFNTWRSVKKAHRIIVPSESIKQDLVELYECPEKKIVVIPYGTQEIPQFQMFSYEKEQKFRKRFKIHEDDVYLLFIGCLEPRKNLVRFLKAFHLFREKFPEWKLILAGKKGKDFINILKTVEGLSLQQVVLTPGYITEEEKAFLLENCRLVVLPSLYEGFGPTILEAFAHKKPVLASKIPALQEIALDAALYVDPYNVENIQKGLLKLASDPFFAQQLARKGEKHLKNFSFEKTAEAILEVLLTD